MKKIFLTLAILFSMFVLSQTVKGTNKSSDANLILDNYLKKTFKNENPRPSEYKNARKVMYYDFDADGDEDLYVFFTLEGFGGGNNWQHYLAVFEMENNLVKAVDNMVLFGDSWKKYNNGEFIKFKNGYLYYRLYGYNRETKENFVETIGFTFYKKKIITDKPM